MSNVTIYLVDDDPSVRRATQRLLTTCGYRVECFESAQAFLEQAKPHGVGCLLLDVQMPGLSGLDLQHALAEQATSLPVVFLTGHGTIPMTVQAMKRGAFEFLQKPVSEDVLLHAVTGAIERSRAAVDQVAAAADLKRRFESLTPREREVFDRVTAGMLNKQIAADLRIAEKTVKVHRARVMEKLQADSVADLVRFAHQVQASRASSL